MLCGLVLIPFVEPPTPAWVGGDELSGDRRPAFLALGMLAAFVVILLVPALRGFFELRLLPPLDYVLIGRRGDRVGIRPAFCVAEALFRAVVESLDLTPRRKRPRRV